jgi:methylase of polypeptide subunit release factors
MGDFRVCVQGHWLSLKTEGGVEPTPFSLIVANLVVVHVTDRTAVDAGAGGGILAIALARLGLEHVVGIERDARACEVFAENLRRNDVVSRVQVVHGDIREYHPEAPVDLVVANPPTIPEHEGLPDFVRGGGPDGMTFLRLLLGHSGGWLTPDGSLQFVVSSLVEWRRLQQLASEYGWGLHARGSILVPIRSFYKTAYGTHSDGGLQLPGGRVDGRVFHESEIVTVYHARRHREGEHQTSAEHPRPASGA